MPTFADIRKKAAAQVRASDSKTGTGMNYAATPDNLKTMTTDKINFQGNKPGSATTSPTDTGWTAVNNASKGYGFESQTGTDIMTRIAAKKKKGS